MNSELQQPKLSAYQRTLNDSFTCIGVGLHSGLKIIMSVLPAEVNTGYRFVRRDIASGRNEIFAAWHSVVDTHLSTTIANNFGVRVSTVEHLIAALHASQIDNAVIVLDGPEVPIMDGSAKAFIELIDSVGTQQQDAERRAIVIKKEIAVSDGDKQARLSPYAAPRIELEIKFDSKVIGKQKFAVDMDTELFREQLAGARTFGFSAQMQTLKQLGFVRGGSLKNAILVDKNGVVNEEGLRFKDEFVRHKVLDCVGDLALANAPIIGKFSGKLSGHKLNNYLLREMMFNHGAFEFVPIRKLVANEQLQFPRPQKPKSLSPAS